MTGGKRYTTSIVICTLNRAEALFRCIRTILAQTILPQELIIVDAGNIPSLENQIADLIHSTQIQLIYLREKPSTTRQRNVGIKTAASDILFFLDDDVLLAETYIEEILRTYASKEDDNIGGARGTLMNRLNPARLCAIDSVYRKAFFLGEDPSDGISRLKKSGFPIYVHNPPCVRRCEIMPGGVSSYKSEVLMEFQFDESHEGYVFAEDVDLSFRVSRKYDLFVTPYAKAFHNHPPMSRPDPIEAVKRQLYFTHYFWRKNNPQTIAHILCHYWALLGVVGRSCILSLKNGNSRRLKDSLKLLRSINKKG